MKGRTIGKALPGKGKADHEHRVVLTGSFKKEESQERAHKKRQQKKRG
jgi:hypothetical protein